MAFGNFILSVKCRGTRLFAESVSSHLNIFFRKRKSEHFEVDPEDLAVEIGDRRFRKSRKNFSDPFVVGSVGSVGSVGPLAVFFPGINVIKLFRSVICECSKQSRVLVFGKLFQPILTNTLAYYENLLIIVKMS